MYISDIIYKDLSILPVLILVVSSYFLFVSLFVILVAILIVVSYVISYNLIAALYSVLLYYSRFTTVILPNMFSVYDVAICDYDIFLYL